MARRLSHGPIGVALAVSLALGGLTACSGETEGDGIEELIGADGRQGDGSLNGGLPNDGTDPTDPTEPIDD